LVVYCQDDFESVSVTPRFTFGGTLVGRAINDTPENGFYSINDIQKYKSYLPSKNIHCSILKIEL